MRERQRAWAKSKGIALDSAGYTGTLRDNLYQALSPCAEAEFRSGDGAELGKPGERGKMQALHSSSALACNVFDYWRGRDTAALAQALDVPGPICSIAFERKYPTGLRGKPPNLDIVLQPASGPTLAIESKFLEPYTAGTRKAGFKGKYFKSESGLWSDLGYPSCQKLAKSLYEGDYSSTWLHGEQLLKHILGLSRTGREWILLYLWYEVPGETIVQHAEDIAEFARCATEDGVSFRSLSYQELFRRLQAVTDPRDAGYIQYLRKGTFPTSLPNPRMQPTGRSGPRLRLGAGFLWAEQWKRRFVRAPA
jgi:hypothetical protein